MKDIDKVKDASDFCKIQFWEVTAALKFFLILKQWAAMMLQRYSMGVCKKM
ncbi:hypothetical protein F7734_60015 [Scytonema sp. UIC 10036]|nr:hypothetical protein [Scytonema sp. UIC 10036]MUH01814.1 hypothetical protein [Scytonema sp. UIC 10036]